MKCEVFKYHSIRNHGVCSLVCHFHFLFTFGVLHLECFEITTSNVTWNAVFFFVCFYDAVRAAFLPATRVLKAVLYAVFESCEI